MDDRHAVDEEHEVAAAVMEQRFPRVKTGLSRDLVDARPAGNVLTREQCQIYRLTEVSRIVGVVTANGHGTAVYEAVCLKGRIRRADQAP